MMESGSTSHSTFQDALAAVGLSVPEQTRAESTVRDRLGLDPANFVWHTTPGTREAVGAKSPHENNLIWVTSASVTVHPQLGVTATPDGLRPNGFPRYNHDGSSYVAGGRNAGGHRLAPEPEVCPRCFIAHAGECI
jgi:hypothetical protein